VDEDIDILLGDEASQPSRPSAHRSIAHRARTWLAGVALSAALAAGVLFAYREWIAVPAPPPFVVLGGEVETTDGRVTRAPAAAPAAVVESHSAPPRQPPATDPYSAVLARQQDRIRRCFTSSGTDISGIPELSVSLAIDRRGAVTRVALTPSELESTQLGQCLLATVRRARFARQANRVQVTIPLRVRRTR
jgi:hypothetical protein